MGAEEFFIGGHQAGLAHGGAGLQLGQVAGAFLVPQRAHARADRPRGHHNNLLTRLALFGELRHQLLHLGQVRLLPAVGQDAGSQFHHDTGDGFEQFGAHGQFGSKSDLSGQTRSPIHHVISRCAGSGDPAYKFLSAACPHAAGLLSSC